MVKERPLREIVGLIEGRKPFTLSCWAKPQWMALFGERNGYVPRDGYWYFHRLCRDLSDLIQSRPEYMLGLCSDAVAHYGDRVANYITGLGLHDLTWCKDALRVDTPDQLQAVIGAVSRVPLVVVGPPQLRRARNLLRYQSFVDVPPRNQYLAREDIVRNALAVLEDHKKPALVTVSAGVVGPLVVDDLYRRVGDLHQVVDVHRLWEPFARARDFA